MNLYVEKNIFIAPPCNENKRPAPIYRRLSFKRCIMRISILAILLTISGLMMAATGSGQDLSKITVSIDLRNASLKQAFKKIESLADCSFTYRTKDVAGYNNITYRAANIPVDRLLDELLRTTDLRYEQVNANIVIKKGNNITLGMF